MTKIHTYNKDEAFIVKLVLAAREELDFGKAISRVSKMLNSREIKVYHRPDVPALSIIKKNSNFKKSSNVPEGMVSSMELFISLFKKRSTWTVKELTQEVLLAKKAKTLHTQISTDAWIVHGTLRQLVAKGIVAKEKDSKGIFYEYIGEGGLV